MTIDWRLKGALAALGLAAGAAAVLVWFAPGRSHLSMTTAKGEVHAGEPVEFRLILHTEGRVPIRRDIPSNFSVRLGVSEIGTEPGPLASGLSVDMDPSQVRIARGERLTASFSGVFEVREGKLVFVREGRKPVAVGSFGLHEVHASFAPYTSDPRTLYRGESFARPVRIVVLPAASR